jgi:hypothetical protein
MRTSVVFVAAVAMAAAAMLAPAAAHAKGGGGGGGKGHSFGGGGGMKSGGGMKVGGASHQHRNHNRFRRDSLPAPSYKAEDKLVKRTKPPIVPSQTAPLIRYADGKGRAYDLASKVWCDGNNHCWSGKYAWTFKNNAWFYGNHRWFESNGTWRTNAVEAPTVVDCETVPAFAAIKPTTGQEATRRDTDDGAQAAARPAAPQAAADRSAKLDASAKPSECLRYFATVGATLPVPCDG